MTATKPSDDRQRHERGDLVAGRYHLERALFDTEDATWWDATDMELNRPVTLKVLRPSLASDEERTAELRDEGRAAAGVIHPCAIAVYDTINAEGDAAILMEPFDAQPMRSLASARGIFDQETALNLFNQIATVVAHAHRTGIFHGELRPEVIRVRANGDVVVAGFGSHGRAPTNNYLSPEQIDGKGPSVAGDVYSLAATAYELLSGQRPDNHRGPPPRLHHQSQVPWAIADVIMDGLESEAALRPASVNALRESVMTAAADPEADPRRSTPRLDSGRRRWLYPVAALVALAVIVVVAINLVGGDGNDTTNVTIVRATPAASTVAAEVGDTGAAPEATASSTAAPESTGTGTDSNDGSDAGVAGAESATVAPTPSPSPTEPPPTATPEPIVLPVVSLASGFDPPPGSGEENSALAGTIFDGATGTEWTTEIYRTPGFGGLKTGVGIYVALVTPATVETITLRSSTPSWTAQIFVADQPGASLAGWGEPLTSVEMRPEFGGTVTVEIEPVQAQAVLIWFTELGSLSGGFGVAIDEIIFGEG